jgi:hypothetical protein
VSRAPRGEGAKPLGAGFGAEPRLSEPGASNTRRITPGARKEGGARHGDLGRSRREPHDSGGKGEPTPVHYTTPLVLGRRADWLTVAFRGELSEAATTLLAERLTAARALRTAVCVDLAPGVSLSLSARSHDGWWQLANAEIRVVVDLRAAGEWRVEVTAGALLLARVGLATAFDCARRVAASLLAAIKDERVRRVDLCADLVGFNLRSVDASAWVAPQRCVVDAISMHEFSRGAVRTGFAIGKSDIRLRVYDKTEELRLARNDGDKRDEEHARWRAAGWDGAADVTRVEFQVRGDALKELGLREPRVLLDRLDAVWGYCTRKWVRLVRRDTATRRERCHTDARWGVVQRVTFARADGEIATRVRVRSPARARLVAGVALNYAASVGAIESMAVGDARAHVVPWTERAAEAFVRKRLATVMWRASAEAAQDLLRAYGPKDAAAYLIERGNAAIARASTVSDDVAERKAIADAA